MGEEDDQNRFREPSDVVEEQNIFPQNYSENFDANLMQMIQMQIDSGLIDAEEIAKNPAFLSLYQNMFNQMSQ